jgi:hypothetical protein
MISARNGGDAHAENFVVNDELLLPNLEMRVRCTNSAHAQYALLEMLESFQPVCKRTVCRSYQYSSVAPHRAIPPPPLPRRGSSRGLWSELQSLLLIPISCGLTDVILPCSTERISLNTPTNKSVHHFSHSAYHN